MTFNDRCHQSGRVAHTRRQSGCVAYTRQYLCGILLNGRIYMHSEELVLLVASLKQSSATSGSRVTDSTQDWIGNVSAPMLTWQSQKERSGSNLYPNVSVSVVTWHSWKKRQSRRNLELNFYTSSRNPEMTLALAFLSQWWNCIFESREIFSHGCQEFLTTNDC